MKLLKITYLIPIILFCFSNTNLMAQAPEGINYQAVFRNSNGNIVAGQQLSCRVEIIQGNISGLLTYSEKHGPTTNQQGIANFIIGGGQPIQGVFADMDWGNGPYYMKLYVDFDGQGSLFQMQQYGVQQLISVPYALHAKVADSIAGGGGGSGGGTDDQNLSGANLNGTDLQIDIEDGNSVTVDLAPLQDGTGTDDQNLSGANLNGTELQIDIEDGNSATVDLAPLQDGVDDADSDPTNELNSSIGINGTNLEITDNGGTLSVDLSPIDSDDQILTSAELNGSNLDITIENGNTVSADVSALYNEDYDWLKAQQMMEWPNSIDDNIYRMGKVGIGTYNLAGKFKIDMYDPWPGGGCEGCQTIDFRRLHPGLNGNTFGFTSISYNAEPTNANTGGYSMFNLYNANWGTHENRYFGLSFDGESGLYIRKEFNGDYNGYVGIGTTSPIRKLDIRESVDGTTDQENPGEANLLLLKNTGLIGNSNAYKTVSIAFSAVNTDAKIVAGNENPTGGEDGYLAFQTRKAETLNEVLRINSDGNVGINEISPTEKLDVNGNLRLRGSLYDTNNDPGTPDDILMSTATGIDWIDASIYMDNTDNQSLSINSGQLLISGGNSVPISSFYDNLGNHIAGQNIRLNSYWLSNDGSNEGINIDNSGNTRTSGNLTVDNYLYMDDYSNGNSTTNIQASAIGRNGSFVFYSGGVYVGQLGSTSSVNVSTGDSQVAGNAAIGGNIETNIKLRVHGRLKSSGIEELSDERWKKNITPISGALEKIGQINGVYYDWRKDEFPDQGFDDKRQAGFIAQEIERVFPEVVNTDDKGFKSVMYGHVVPLLVEAIKDLENQLNEKSVLINSQSKEIQDIKASLNKIQNQLDNENNVVKH